MARSKPVPLGPPPQPAVQRLRVRFAKRGRLRFASHRDVARAIERAVRRSGLPVAYSGGFNPHPKLSYAGAAPTGVASEAEYFEIALTALCVPGDASDRLGAALPAGLDVIDVTEPRGGTMADQLQVSEWRAMLPETQSEAAAAACRMFMDEGRVEVERSTAKGIRRVDARAAVLELELDPRAVDSCTGGCAILRMVVRHVTPAVRPDDVLAALRQVAGLAPPSPPLVTRLAQGLLGAAAGGLFEPGAADSAAADCDTADGGAATGGASLGSLGP
ncbi:MAG TPA: TIGR03936 family radical SAM-associated protein [Streptosporangiaceae bacterium]|nr:TIGR03936 family radical SAM-associated protein [Streptosporangiaceae bacterium]